jgi:hypothetical protein
MKFAEKYVAATFLFAIFLWIFRADFDLAPDSNCASWTGYTLLLFSPSEARLPPLPACLLYFFVAKLVFLGACPDGTEFSLHGSMRRFTHLLFLKKSAGIFWRTLFPPFCLPYLSF